MVSVPLEVSQWGESCMTRQDSEWRAELRLTLQHDRLHTITPPPRQPRQLGRGSEILQDKVWGLWWVLWRHHFSSSRTGFNFTFTFQPRLHLHQSLLQDQFWILPQHWRGQSRWRLPSTEILPGMCWARLDWQSRLSIFSDDCREKRFKFVLKENSILHLIFRYPSPLRGVWRTQLMAKYKSPNPSS